MCNMRCNMRYNMRYNMRCNMRCNTNVAHYSIIFIVIIVKETPSCLRIVLNGFHMILIIAFIY